ncbi:MAG: response regulator, partial [Bacteroidota bacterium]
HNEFNRVCHYQAPDGSLYFGGLNGITYFHPENLQKKQLIDLPLVLTHFQQFDGDQNQLVDRTAELQQTPTISMATSDRFFRLEFSLLSFTDASNNRYAYKVEGVDADWNYQSENFIRLSRLPFGTHRMRIKGQTSNGHWSSQELAFQVVVARPFYLRWWFFVLLAGLLLGGILGWTRRRNAQYRMQQEALEKLVLERTEQIRKDKQTIEQQAEELRQLDSVKSRFFANISHELRTPLTLILGPLASVIDSHDNNPKNQQLLLLMQQNGKQLLRLVDEIMDLTKLEAGKMQLQLEATQLQVLIRRIAAAFYALAEKEGIQFSVDYQADPDLCIWLDVHKFEMLVANLLSNAFKFSSQAGRVVLQIIQETDQLHLQVQDSGRGIHPDDLPHIFNRFYQTRREDAAAEGGTGIGLALCTEFAKLFNGRVWAESEWGQGSTFHFAFPLQLAPNNSLTPSLDMPIEPVADASAQSDPPLAVEGVGKRSILIVEDHSDLRNYLKSILDDHHHCHLAENGADAIKQLEHLTPDLILSDIMMPVMDGFQLLEKLKSQDEWRHIPIVMLTARSELSDKLKALRIGVDDYLLKPFEAEELLVRINNLLRNGQLKQQEAKTNGTSDASSSSPLISQEEQAWLHQLEELLQKNLDKPHFKIDQMAESMHISRRQLFRNIKRLTGLTPNQYLQENRLQKARQCVENREFRTVKAVAYASGFSNVGYFTKLYKRRFGKLPSDSSLKVN